MSMSYALTEPLYTSKLEKLNLDLLISYHNRFKEQVSRRIADFSALRAAGNERLFCELSYCILTPQSNALKCDSIVAELEKRGVLKDPLIKQSELEEALRGARFWRNKTRYIIKSWERFASRSEDCISSELSMRCRGESDNQSLRNWLREEMRGMGIGMKEASHFLRNVGYGEGIAILDRHILKCLSELNIIHENEINLRSQKDYLRIEERALEFSEEVGLPMEELDLLFWSAKTGFIYK